MLIKKWVRWTLMATFLVALLATPNPVLAWSGGAYQGGCNSYYPQSGCCNQIYYPQSGCCYQGGGNGCWRPVYPPWNPWNPPYHPSYPPYHPSYPPYHPSYPPYHPSYPPRHSWYPWHTGW